MKTNQIRVTGKVQGVYFRASAKQKAQMLGVNGYVRNELDGSVVLEIEGDDEAVDYMTDWCKHGPALARVKNVEVKNEASRNFVSFDIKK
ncbi:MAG: acylphosphatase [Bacteroidia bacterium]|nr:acylphosphatase [Bacteroidia bacterium]NNJ56538.1 acylphosphatase [Bacteroidia bacterium]